MASETENRVHGQQFVFLPRNVEITVTSPGSPQLDPGIGDELLHFISTFDFGQMTLAQVGNSVTEIGFTRKVALAHPGDPENIYVIGGVGLGRRQGNQVIFDLPDPTQTVQDLLPVRLKGESMRTAFVQSDGTLFTVENLEPAGAYTAMALQEKVEGTSRIRRLLQSKRRNDILLPQILIHGSYEANPDLHWLVYRIPKLLEPDQVGVEEAFTRIEKSIDAIKFLHENDIVHNQPHGDNLSLAMRNGKYYPVMGDLDTIQDVRRHGTIPVTVHPNLMLSPQIFAKWRDMVRCISGYAHMLQNSPELTGMVEMRGIAQYLGLPRSADRKVTSIFNKHAILDPKIESDKVSYSAYLVYATMLEILASEPAASPKKKNQPKPFKRSW